jgi:hypothetical protein
MVVSPFPNTLDPSHAPTGPSHGEMDRHTPELDRHIAQIGPSRFAVEAAVHAVLITENGASAVSSMPRVEV